MSLPAELSISRDEIAEIFRIADALGAAVAALPHRDAKPAMTEIDALRELAGERLPGGYVGRCESCEQPIGADEVAASDTEDGCEFCLDCVARWNRPKAAQAAEPAIRIEAGKFYRDRTGKRVGPMALPVWNDYLATLASDATDEPAYSGPLWFLNGRFFMNSKDPRDLVAEWADDVDADAKAQAAVEAGTPIKRPNIELTPDGFQLLKQLHRGRVRSTHSATQAAAFALEREGAARQVSSAEWEITELGANYLRRRGVAK